MLNLLQNLYTEEHSFKEAAIDFTTKEGDILGSDKISGLEIRLSHVIIKDNKGRFWRHESSSIQIILEKLHVFLMENNNSSDFQDKLIYFNEGVLNDLNDLNLLEDDASLGIIITEDVLKLYRK